MLVGVEQDTTISRTMRRAMDISRVPCVLRIKFARFALKAMRRDTLGVAVLPIQLFGGALYPISKLNLV